MNDDTEDYTFSEQEKRQARDVIQKARETNGALTRSVLAILSAYFHEWPTAKCSALAKQIAH